MNLIFVTVKTSIGEFIARGDRVNESMKAHTRRELVARLRQERPEIFNANGSSWMSWMAQPEFVVATILNKL